MTQEQMEFAAPSPQDEIARLTRELESERSYRKQIEKDLQKFRRTHWAYKAIDDIYKSLKRDAENDAQEPFDEHFRECLYGLQGIAANPDNCTCKARGWHGEGHDCECPIRIATDAVERADNALGEGLARNPYYVGVKGGAPLAAPAHRIRRIRPREF
jgi:hypothetical protein